MNENKAWYSAIARPVFVFVSATILLANYALPTIAGVFDKNHSVIPIDLPAELIWMMGVAFLGYGYLRTSEKVGALPPFTKK